jgi:hypothetical protein
MGNFFNNLFGSASVHNNQKKKNNTVPITNEEQPKKSNGKLLGKLLDTLEPKIEETSPIIVGGGSGGSGGTYGISSWGNSLSAGPGGSGGSGGGGYINGYSTYTGTASSNGVGQAGGGYSTTYTPVGYSVVASYGMGIGGSYISPQPQKQQEQPQSSSKKLLNKLLDELEPEVETPIENQNFSTWTQTYTNAPSYYGVNNTTNITSGGTGNTTVNGNAF